jgi:hypothetical protein
MAEKVGRNDPCPCGSGKKYKRCCLTKSQGHRAIDWPTFPEEQVVSGLLQSCPEFRAFYELERGKIQSPLYWAKDISLRQGIDFRMSRAKSESRMIHVIRLRRVPPSTRDAFKIAHELEHVVLDGEGFPSTYPKVPDTDVDYLSSALNSMVHDPIVNSRLRGYGLDPRKDYENEEAEWRHQLSGESAPTARIDRLRWMVYYVADILEWQVAYDSPDLDGGESESWFDGHFPDIAAEGRELLARVAAEGYDTPGKQRTLFEGIIREYDIDRIIGL